MERDLSITEVEANNFKGFEAIKVKINGKHMRIFGRNGSGKSTLKQIIHGCCMRVSQKGSKGELVDERYRVIGKHGVSADLKTVFEDVKGGFTVTVENHITKAANKLKITASDGRTLDEEWLREFFNVAFLSADTFVAHTPKEQALLLGIDTSEYDVKIEDIKKDAATIRRDIKILGEPEDLPKVEPVDLHELYTERDRIKAFNENQDSLQESRRQQTNIISSCKSVIAELEQKLREAKKNLKGYEYDLENMTHPAGQLAITHIIDKIDGANDVNLKAAAYMANEDKRLKKEMATKELAQCQADIDNANAKRTEYIKGFKLPLKGMTVDETGGLLLKDRLLRSYSKGERELIVANLRIAMNPHNKTCWIDNFETLDPANQKKIVKSLVDQGNTVITSEVGATKKGDGSILLEGCAVAGDNKAEEEDTRPDAL